MPFNCKGNLSPDLLIKLHLQPACLQHRDCTEPAFESLEDFAAGETRQLEKRGEGMKGKRGCGADKGKPGSEVNGTKTGKRRRDVKGDGSTRPAA